MVAREMETDVLLALCRIRCLLMRLCRQEEETDPYVDDHGKCTSHYQNDRFQSASLVALEDDRTRGD